MCQYNLQIHLSETKEISKDILVNQPAVTEAIKMCNNSSSSSHDIIPKRSYFHEHPLYTFRQYQVDIQRYEIQNPEEECTQYTNYLDHLTYQSIIYSEKFIRQMTCPCLAHRIGFCLHNLPNDSTDILAIMASRKFHARVSVFQSNFDPDVLSKFSQIADMWKTYSQVYVRCENCRLVMKSDAFDHIPRHKCHKNSGSSTSFRYKMPFRTPASEIITLDSKVLPVGWTHVYLLDDEAAKVEEMLQKLRVRANIVNVMLQDPLFIELTEVLKFGRQEWDIDPSTVTYGLYLYLRFRLIPYISNLRQEDIDERLNPVPVMLELNADFGPHHTAITEALVNKSRNEVDELLKNYRIYTLNFMMNTPIPDLVEKMFDDFLQEDKREEVIKVYKILSNFRPISQLMRKIIDYCIDKGLAAPHNYYSKHFHYWVPDVSDRYWMTLSNIFNVIINDRYVQLDSVSLWLGIHERDLKKRIPFKDILPQFQPISRRLTF